MIGFINSIGTVLDVVTGPVSTPMFAVVLAGGFLWLNHSVHGGAK